MVDVNPKLTSNLDALTLVAGMAGKPIAERLVSPVVGNGTLVSGAIKMAVAVVAQKAIGGKIGNIVTVSFGADGAEDILLGFSGSKFTTVQGGEEVDF